VFPAKTFRPAPAVDPSDYPYRIIENAARYPFSAGGSGAHMLADRDLLFRLGFLYRYGSLNRGGDRAAFGGDV